MIYLLYRVCAKSETFFCIKIVIFNLTGFWYGKKKASFFIRMRQFLLKLDSWSPQAGFRFGGGEILKLNSSVCILGYENATQIWFLFKTNLSSNFSDVIH